MYYFENNQTYTKNNRIYLKGCVVDIISFIVIIIHVVESRYCEIVVSEFIIDFYMIFIWIGGKGKGIVYLTNSCVFLTVASRVYMI